ncbi:histone-fold-containing protein [Xylariaceae sp. FL0255]|nr:histone-fold-containing protein [Xylariaceae sp. FL0255]
MPPKKTVVDPTKRGDVSMAQFVYDGDHGESAAPAVPSLKPSTSATTTTAAFAPSTPMDTDQQLQPADATDKEKDKKDKENHVTIEDLNLPKSIITRLAKGVLPPNTQIQANAITAMSKSATVFINHLANAYALCDYLTYLTWPLLTKWIPSANEHTMNNHKKTIMPGDVFAALEDIEFPFLRERLEAEFKKFNETQTTKRNTYRRKVAAQKKADKLGQSTASDPNASMMSTASGMTEATDSAPPRSKKQKPNDVDDSAMDIDGDETQEPRDASDPESEPEQEEEEDDEEEEQENDDEDDNEEENDHDLPDRLEEKEERDDDDDALDDGADSD